MDNENTDQGSSPQPDGGSEESTEVTAEAPHRGDEEFQQAQEEHQERTATDADELANQGLDRPVTDGVDDQSADQPPEVTGENDQVADAGD